MVQAEETRARLCAAHGWAEDAVELVPVVASGDRIQDRPLADIGGKALWTRELDAWLAEGRIDAAVHSMKDVETLRPAELAIAAILPRADKRDVLLGAASIAALPHGRGGRHQRAAPRGAAAAMCGPTARVVSLRGNVATRMAKLAAGEVQATFLAAAGLERLGESGAGHPLALDEWLPAPAQAAIGIECRSGDARVRALLAAIDHAPSRAEIEAERGLLAALGGSCHSPIAVLCTPDAGGLEMTAVIFSPDGAERVAGKARFAIGDEAGPARLAADLLARATPGIAAVFTGSA